MVGAGSIAREYVKVLEALGHQVLVVGRGEKNIVELKSAHPDVEAFSGGLGNWLQSNKPPTNAIIATPIENLAASTFCLLQAGCKNILVEKPLSYSIQETEDLAELARQKTATVSIAFNRRNYVSVQAAKEFIRRDGGISSFHFDFTEAIFRIDPKNYSLATNENWGIANSSHVIDTAFYLGGKPGWMECRQYGMAVKWHPAGSIFTGIGETKEGVPFTYHANWGCPGKWNIEIMTPERKLLFSPMERLHQQVKGEFKIGLVEIDYSLDIEFKPGFYQQVKAWLKNNSDLLSISDMVEELNAFNRFFSY